MHVKQIDTGQGRHVFMQRLTVPTGHCQNMNQQKRNKVRIDYETKKKMLCRNFN